MPTYDFKCPKCGYETSVFTTKIESFDEVVSCDECKEPMVKKVSTGTIHVWKGKK